MLHQWPNKRVKKRSPCITHEVVQPSRKQQLAFKAAKRNFSNTYFSEEYTSIRDKFNILLLSPTEDLLMIFVSAALKPQNNSGPL